MKPSNGELNALLRCQLTAVNQQFAHMLCLRSWGLSEMAKAIASVDDVDFPNAMWLMDRLIQETGGLDIQSEGFVPGVDPASVVKAECAMEQRMEKVVQAAENAGELGRRSAERTSAPRRAYWIWLEEASLKATSWEEPATFPELSTLFAALVVMSEQSMAHAFILRMRKETEASDQAWAASGEAMMKMTALVRACAALKGMTRASAPPPLKIGDDPNRIREFDAELALVCEAAANAAVEKLEQPSIAALGKEIAAYAASLASWNPGMEHPAMGRNPTFASFAATCEKFVEPLN
jgi:bacterioferritin (cytochrome b1)